jgi:hypothetical protein
MSKSNDVQNTFFWGGLPRWLGYHLRVNLSMVRKNAYFPFPESGREIDLSA